MPAIYMPKSPPPEESVQLQNQEKKHLRKEQKTRQYKIHRKQRMGLIYLYIIKEAIIKVNMKGIIKRI